LTCPSRTLHPRLPHPYPLPPSVSPTSISQPPRIAWPAFPDKRVLFQLRGAALTGLHDKKKTSFKLATATPTDPAVSRRAVGAAGTQLRQRKRPP
jgi:hypothetical protein